MKIHVPLSQLVEQVSMNLALVWDIYVYGSSDQETAAAASIKAAGYQNVAEATCFAGGV